MTGFLSKLDITGKPEWTKRIGYDLGNVLNPKITRDSIGNLYVIMESRLRVSNGIIHKLVVEKWTDQGVRKWRIDMGGAGPNVNPDITIANNELYVSYSTFQPILVGRGDYDAVISRLVPTSGRILNSVLIGSTGADHPIAITSTTNGDIVLAGYTSGRLYGVRPQGRTDEDLFLIQLPPDLGPVRMGRQWGTRANDRADDVVALSDGGFIVVGQTAGQPSGLAIGTTGRIDGVITKISANGNFIWEYQVGSAADDRIVGIEQSKATGNVLVVGRTAGVVFGGSSGECDIIGATFNSQTGALLYSKQFGTSACDMATSLKLRNDGSPVIGGSTYGSFDAVQPLDTDAFVLSAGMQLPDLSMFVGSRSSIPVIALPELPNIQVPASEQSSAVGVPMAEATPLLCNEAVSPTVKWRREVATCAGLVVKNGTTTRIRLSLRNAPGVCSLSPRKRLKLTAPGTCKVKIRATQSNGTTKAVWIKYTVS